MSTCSQVLVLVPVLVNVAFFTLMERKVLGLSQSRVGPNKAGAVGLVQPFADAVKLFVKEVLSPKFSSKFMFMLAPTASLALMLMLWSLLVFSSRTGGVEFNSLAIIMIMGMGVYPLLLAGWSSMSAYATLGAIRGVAQTVSYEISLAILLLSVLVLGGSTELGQCYMNLPTMGVLCTFSVLFLFLISCVAESNRTPFDFAEGESELVSGFNVEYGGGPFALIFMAEYGSILFLSGLIASCCLMSAVTNMSSIIAIVFAFIWVWLRATLPRYRYDKLMSLAWKSLLPLALSMLVFFLGMVSGF